MRNEIEEKIADILSDYVDSLNRGDAPAISEILEKNKEIANALLPELETAKTIYRQFVMKKAPKEFKEKLRKKLLAKMESMAKEALREKKHSILRYLRERIHKSLGQVSEETGIPQDTLIALETPGKRGYLTPRSWAGLAKVYQVEIKKLGIILGKVKPESSRLGLTFATQYIGEDLTQEEKELIEKFFKYKNKNKNGK